MSERFSKPARAVAVEALCQFDAQRAQSLSGRRKKPRAAEAAQPMAHLAAILEPLLEHTDQRQRATDLVYGAVRHLRTLDAVLTKSSGRPTGRIARPLLAILRIGAYELIYSPATPPYSIVDEAVKIARRFGGSKQTGFVNAILRQVLRHITAREVSLAESMPTRTLIQSPQSGCQFDVDLLADPESAPAEYLSACFSLPHWLIEDWLATFGFEATREICLGSNRRPSLYVRANLLKTTVAELLDNFEKAGVGAEAVGEAAPEMMRLIGPQAVVKLPGFAEGLFTVQDLSASEAVRMLDPQPGWKILDLCAAPGTKTMQLAEATGDAAEIVATDIDAERLKKVGENVARLGLKSVKVVQSPKNFEVAEFDAVLLDVPCSNTGVLARRIEVRFRISADRLKEMTRTQRALLESAAKLVRPGGRICYSTCSIQRAENADVVKGFLATNRLFELVGESFVTPSAESPDRDGAYVAILRQKIQ